MNKNSIVPFNMISCVVRDIIEMLFMSHTQIHDEIHIIIRQPRWLSGLRRSLVHSL